MEAAMVSYSLPRLLVFQEPDGTIVLEIRDQDGEIISNALMEAKHRDRLVHALLNPTRRS